MQERWATTGKWSEVQAILDQYVATNPDGTNNRTAQQQEILAELLERVQPYLRKVASHMLNGGTTIKTARGRIRMSVPPRDNTIEDLAQAGSIGIIKRIHSYDATRSSACTFLHYAAAAEMQIEGIQNTTIRVPPKHATRTKHLSTKKAAIDAMTEQGFTTDTAEATYHMLNGTHPSTDDIILDSKGSTRTFGSMHCVEPSPEHALLANMHRAKIVRECLATLTPRQREVIEYRFGLHPDAREQELEFREIGRTLSPPITRQGAQVLEKTAMRRMRTASPQYAHR